MKFSCNTQDFLQALQLVSRAIGSQQALPILGNILMVVEGKRCTVSATDLELSIITSFEAKIENEGSITIPARAILNFAQYNTDTEVLLETSEGTQLKCTSKHAKTLIAGEAASEYPTITPVEKQTSFSMEAAPLLNALDLVTFASAKNALRPVLSGVYFRSEKGKLILVATDSYRLSEYTIPTEGGDVDISCIIPVKILEELRAILSGKKDKEKKGKEKDDDEKKESAKMPARVEATLSKQQIELQVGGTKLLSRLIDGKFPDYQQIIPKESVTKSQFPVKDLITAVRRMHYFAKETNNNLTFHLKGEQARVVTQQTQVGKDEALIGIETTGEENKIALSSSYLLDFLSHVQGDTVEMQVTDSMHPAVFSVPKDALFLHLIMPLRMQEE
ncbi:MAG: DNA polymerase III subunit beta [Candidatus Peregrinibacteria bacterium]|nr:DNA polymerase III subunit beta [Candidatus Peregrinibacteria bacterium]